MSENLSNKLKFSTVCVSGRDAVAVSGIGNYSLRDTLLCGQCFRYEEVPCASSELSEFLILSGNTLFDVGERKQGELLFFGMGEDDVKRLAVPFFALDLDLEEIRLDIIKRTDSEWLIKASEAAKGIAILRQEPWEALLSFIISQNNNIPRIRGMIKKLCAEYGVNLSLQNGSKTCPLSRSGDAPCEEKCKKCGVCYTFPTASDIAKRPDGMAVCNPGFRFKYMLDAVEKIDTGAVELEKISEAHSYDVTMEALMQIKGVGEKVASCTALFGFGNLEAFPIDVWMKRAIDTYFGGSLDYFALGKYRGIAQQYIFHYIRNIEES